MRRARNGLLAIVLVVTMTASVLGATTTVAAAEDVVPTITTQPVGRTVYVTQSVTLTAAATPFTSVQWQRKLVHESTWTNVTTGVTTTGTTSRYQASYSPSTDVRAIFTNGTASATTDVATIAVQPEIWTQPTSALHPAGSSPAITATIRCHDCVPGPTVQWQRRSSDGTTWDDVPGGTVTQSTSPYSLYLWYARLPFAGLTHADAGTYRAVASNSLASNTTNAVTLAVGSVPSIGSVTGASGPTGSVATASVTVSGDPTPTVQWQQKLVGDASYSDIPGATGTTYARTLTDELHASFLRVVATNANGTRTSSEAQVKVGVLPVVTSSASPTSATTLGTNISVYPWPGETVTLSTVGSGDPTPTISWTFRPVGGTTVPIPGETGSDLSFTHDPAATSGRYTATYTNRVGTTTRAFDVSTAAAPTVSVSPIDPVRSDGQSVTFQPTVGGNPTSVVTWDRSLDGGATWEPLVANFNNTQTVTARWTIDGAIYRATATNPFGTASAQSTLTLTGAPGVVYQPSATVKTTIGGTATIWASAGGSPTPTVQWERSNDAGATWAPVAGATSTAITIQNAQVSDDQSRFRAVFTNGSGSATSNAATLRVGVPTAELIEVQPWTQRGTFDPDDPEVGPLRPTFAVTATGHPAPTITWHWFRSYGCFECFGGGVIGTGPTFTFSADNGPVPSTRYYVEIRNSLGVVTIDLPIAYAASPRVTTQPTSTEANPGDDVTLTVAGTGTPTPTIQWERSYDGGATWADVPGATATDLVVTTPVAGPEPQLRARLTNVAGTVTSDPATVARDGTAPQVSVAAASAAGPQAGAHGGPVTVTIDASDQVGVESITWSATGADPSAETTVDGSSTVVVIDEIGTTTITATARDEAGNVAELQQTEITIVGLPPAPARARALAADGAIHLTVDPAPPDAHVSGYVVTPFVGAIAQPAQTFDAGAPLVVSGLVNGTTYTALRVAAINARGTGPSANLGALTVGVPSFPTSLRVVGGAGSAVISWLPPVTAGADPTGYTITPYVGSTALPSRLVDPGTSATIDGLENGTTYRFRIASTTPYGTGPSAASAAVTVGVPGAPRTPTALPGDGQATIRWTAPVAMGVEPTGYRITPYLGSVAQAATTVGPSTSATITGLTNGATYTFKVVTLSDNGTSPASTTNQVVIGAPAAPTGTRVYAGDGQITVTWVAPTAGATPTGYRITPYRGITALAPITVGPVTSTTITGLTNGETYTFRISSLAGPAASLPASTAPITAGVPSHPSSLRVTPGDGEATITWLAPPAMGVEPTGYRIVPLLGTTELAPIDVAPGTRATITGLTNGETYTFRIATLSPHGTSVSVRTPAATIGPVP